LIVEKFNKILRRSTGWGKLTVIPALTLPTVPSMTPQDQWADE
jgi:hypothetical protein